MSLVNIDAKLKKILLANHIQQYIKRIIHHYQVRFIPEMQGLFSIHNLILWYTTLTHWRIKIILIDAGKLLTKFNTHDVGIEGTYLNKHNKGRICQTHSKHDSQWWKMRSISSKIRKKTKVSTLITIIQCSFGSLGMAIREEKRNPDWKISNIIMSLFADDMILYIENPKTATRKLLELINEFSKIAEYKSNSISIH